MDACISQLNTVFHETFQDVDIEVNRNTTAQDIDGWDSLMHVTLIMNVENSFGVRFLSSEVAMLNTVGELIDMIRSKQGA